METIWFILVALMLAVYVALDGFDLGAGIIHLFVAQTDSERRLVLRSIGPVWDGNEVWLLAAGGTLYFAFPVLYASGFSGFYLPLMIVLWLLILRGVSIELRNHIANPVWQPFWDVVFALASALLAIFYGVALGNVVRGVPLDQNGWFFEALWTDFSLGPTPGILDWYTILVGLSAFVALTLHGALWVGMKTDDPVSARARHIAYGGWWGVAAFTVLLTVVTFRVQPQVLESFTARPWGVVFPVLAVAAVIAVWWYLVSHQDKRAFLASCAYLLGMLASVAFGLYPMVLPASTNPAWSLTIYNTKAGAYGLKIGLVWWMIGMALAGAYFVWTYRNFAGKVRLDDEGY